jgi:hypothetical protein
MKTFGRSEVIKKSVGKKKREDVWDELYRLNEFAKKLQPSQRLLDDDGEIIKKIVGNCAQGNRSVNRDL